MNSEEQKKIAEMLWQARLNKHAIPPLTSLHPTISIADAYAISSLNARRRRELPDINAIGKKIGLTSRAVQDQLGVKQPDFGFLTSDMHIPHDGILPSQALIQGKAEGEVAFTLKKDLRGPGITVDDVIEATDSVQTCIEIIDSRIENWKIKIQDTIADNASSAYFVLSPNKISLKKVALDKIPMKLWLNSELKSQGIGTACLDHPCNAVAWLANALADFDSFLQKGDIILSGAYGPVVPIQAGDRCMVEMNGLGEASFSLE